MTTKKTLKKVLPAGKHPADSQKNISSFKLAMDLLDLPVARLIASDIIDARRNYDKQELIKEVAGFFGGNPEIIYHDNGTIEIGED